MEIECKEVISASHELNLPYKSKCTALHGHEYYIEVRIKTEDLNSDGMVIDYSAIKNVINELGHKHLNDIIEQPTAENIVNYLLDKFENLLDRDGSIRVKVSETEKTNARDTRVVRRK